RGEEEGNGRAPLTRALTALSIAPPAHPGQTRRKTLQLRRNPMKRLAPWAVLLTLVTAGPVQAQRKTPSITLTAGKHDYRKVPICVPLQLPEALARTRHTLLMVEGSIVAWGQLTAPGIITEGAKAFGDGPVRRDLHFVVPNLKAGSVVTLQC